MSTVDNTLYKKAKDSNAHHARAFQSHYDLAFEGSTSIESFSVKPVAFMRSPYGQKFAVPRQPGIASKVKSEIEFVPPYSDPQAFVGLESFSHIHVIFIFDKVTDEKFRPMIRPPRLGGNQKVGVYGSRSPFRPNRIGLSVMKLERVENRNGKTVLHVLGADLVDGTPILDVKPYIPFVDAIEDAVGGFATKPPLLKEVEYAPKATEIMHKHQLDIDALTQILAQDPRPAYKGEDDDKEYFALLMGFNVKFKVKDNKVIVLDLLNADTNEDAHKKP